LLDFLLNEIGKKRE